MSGHDELCPWPDPTVTGAECAYCEVIEATRADERERVAQAIETERTDDASPDTTYLAGWLRGMTDAVRIVRAIGSDEPGCLR